MTEQEKQKLAEEKFPYPKKCCYQKRMRIDWQRKNWIKENL